mmetsp:Transcript_1850/g.2661  ORF Transcript_1850/g.2661 Transcript_1850/m.2661 type:complete len:594 (+) Transcript_1850:86-1867(+)|eukprot:CAMPEP_0184864306 /NCGR_PEP_ID=MMETSP0580-20130426/14476_1 /TAXON_ID=1118495 /ORGANISM="Dactyliosolen fragilissimus" /LENGTH=593 /DNA_ID=CAMNT_0027363023 /DNA_START=26 /DNA_END=1807 /DNA_ORIENTATION=+
MVKKLKIKSPKFSLRKKKADETKVAEEVIEDAPPVEVKPDLTPQLTALEEEFPSDDPDDTKLHVALLKRYPESLIKYLLEEDEDSVKKTNSHGELPLHYALKGKESINIGIVKMLLKKYPESARQGDKDMSLPVHVACNDGTIRVDSIKCVIEEYPGAVLAQSQLIIPYEHVKKEVPKKVVVEEPPVPSYGFGCNAFSFLSLSSKEEKEPTPTPAPAPLKPMKIKVDESGFTPLHLAVLTGVSPDVVDLILETDPKCLTLKTTLDRTALDCGMDVMKKYNVYVTSEKDEKTYASLPKSVQNTIASVDSIETKMRTLKDEIRLNAKVEETNNALSLDNKVIVPVGESGRKDPKKLWKKAIFAARIIAKIQRDSLLGPGIPSDFKEAPSKPEGFELPKDLEYIGVDVTIPVGFKRLRWCLLNNQCQFMPKLFYEQYQEFKKVKFDSWDHHEDAIGLPDISDEIEEEFLVGATKKIEYLFPKSIFCGASMAYEVVTLTAHNDYCFGFRKSTSVPQVPFGKSFNAIVQMTVVNMGFKQSRLICSVEPEWIGKQPFVGRQIRNALRTGCSYYFTTLGEQLCNEANPFAEKRETKGAWG